MCVCVYVFAHRKCAICCHPYKDAKKVVSDLAERLGGLLNSKYFDVEAMPEYKPRGRSAQVV